jgi:hypothetical protein
MVGQTEQASHTEIRTLPIIDLDLDALAEIEPPRGYGRD